MQFPKLGISLRSLKRDGSDFSERVNEVSNYNPFSIELMGFAQDLIFNGNLNQQRIDILNQELERFSGKKTFHGPMVCLLYTSPSPRDLSTSRMPSSA